MLKKLGNKAVSAFLALIILIMGNFSYALGHIDCIIGHEMHLECEMECCEESAGCFEEQNSSVELTDENGGCCDTHVEQSKEKDDAVPIVIKPKHNLRHSTGLFNIHLSNLNCVQAFCMITHKFKFTDTIVAFSILRI